MSVHVPNNREASNTVAFTASLSLSAARSSTKLIKPRNLPAGTRFLNKPPRRVTMATNPGNDETASALPPGVTRSGIPLLLPDTVTITDPDLIRSVSAHPDVGRVGNSKLPFIFSYFFAATKFYFPQRDSWAPAMMSDGSQEQATRRERVVQSLAKGFTDDQINRLEAMMKSDEPLSVIGPKCCKLVSETILPLPDGEHLPDEIVAACYGTLQGVGGIANPFAYLAARKARATVEKYICNRFPEQKYPVDLCHDLGAAAHGLRDAVVLFRGKLDQDYMSILGAKPPIASVPRIVLRRTTLDGLFPEDNPLLPNKTLLFLGIGNGATETKDVSFIFGTGTEDRQCPFKQLFLQSVDTILKRNSS